jgi:hypothetical protein
MSVHVVAVLVANLLILLVGAGLAPLLGLAASRRQLAARLGLAYMLGIVVVGALSSYAALLAGAAGIDLGFGAIGLFLLAAASLAAGLRRLPAGERSGRPGLATLAGLAALVPAAALLVQTARALSVKPLQEFDGWVIWATKARALFEFGRVYGPVFASDAYASIHLDYPLLLPSLEAVDLRVMGTFDGTALHLQRALLLAGFAAALWAIVRDAAWPPLAGVGALAVVAAPDVLYQLSTNFADVPLALFVGLGVAALAVWIERGERASLVAATVFLGAAAMTKNEGSLFALAAFVVAAAVVLRAGRGRLLPLGIAFGAWVACQLPWRIWVAAHGIHTQDFRLSNAADPAYLSRTYGRVGTSAGELATQLADSHWAYLVPLAAAGVAAALLARRFAVSAFAVAWLLLGFGGLLVVYWIATLPLTDHLFNTSNRTIDSLVIGGVSLVPVLVGPVEWRRGRR